MPAAAGTSPYVAREAYQGRTPEVPCPGTETVSDSARSETRIPVGCSAVSGPVEVMVTLPLTVRPSIRTETWTSTGPIGRPVATTTSSGHDSPVLHVPVLLPV